LGWLHYQNGNYSKSNTYYKKATELQPKSIEAKLGLANAVSGLGNWDELMQIYEDILKLDPINSSANYKLAYMLHSRRKNSQAIEHIKTVLTHYPFDFDSNLLAGKIYISLGNITDAKVVLNRALIYNPKSFEVANMLKGL
jgi:tetratricopeptide (TPR) repeat protein